MNNISFGLLKPDAISRGLELFIFSKLEHYGLIVVPYKERILTPNDVSELYPHNLGKPFWEDYVGYMTCGPVVPFLIYGRDALRILNEIVGSTRKKDAEKKSIRSISIEDYFPEYECIQNILHSSCDEQALKRELRWLYGIQKR
jgi:nucleoside-diphosphate kinase